MILALQCVKLGKWVLGEMQVAKARQVRDMWYYSNTNIDKNINEKWLSWIFGGVLTQSSLDKHNGVWGRGICNSDKSIKTTLHLCGYATESSISVMDPGGVGLYWCKIDKSIKTNTISCYCMTGTSRSQMDFAA